MTAPGEFTISLHMISDWRIGTGTGAHGYADRLVQRDAEDAPRSPAAPIVPAKTLVGVWRDSCEVAAYALDSGDTSGVWHAWLSYLFGGQYATDTTVLRPAALVLDGPLRFPPRLAELLRATPRVAWATTFRKPGVAIDAKTGTAKPDMLRFEEMSRAGATLLGKGRIDGFAALDQAQRDAALALLGAGARLLETIGGKRRRGAGRCRLTVMGQGFAPEWTSPPLRDVASPPSALPFSVPERPTSPAIGHQGWERAELVITVEEAVLAAATVLGNLVQGETHIPGWCLMPEAVRRIGGAAHALVRTGDLLVTAAFPQSPRGSRTLPMPRVLTHEKGTPEVVAGNRMLGGAPAAKAYKNGYVAPDGDDAYAKISPATTLRMHNTVEDDRQRPTRDIGGVYVYRALAAKAVLHAEVRVRAGRLEPGWENKLAGQWRVGRSSKDDYGKIRVEVRRTAAEHGRDQPARGLLRMWLLSDLLVRDHRLRPSTDPADVARALEQALTTAGAGGVRLIPVTRDWDGAVTSALASHRTESWHRGWGLPRATLYGLAAGSCLTFEVTGGPIAASVLAEVRTAGVGQRRAEGFGQVELDHALLVRPVGEAPRAPEAASTPATEPLAPGTDGYDTARIFERAAWRAEIHRASERIRGVPAERAKVTPPDVPNSQLNALREITADLATGQAENRLTWLTRPKSGRPDWPKQAVEQLKQLLTGPGRIWELLDLPERQLVLTLDGVATLRAELRDEAVRVLVDACLSAHAKAEAARQPERSAR